MSKTISVTYYGQCPHAIKKMDVIAQKIVEEHGGEDNRGYFLAMQLEFQVPASRLAECKAALESHGLEVEEIEEEVE
jgi:hypothetical protein